MDREGRGAFRLPDKDSALRLRVIDDAGRSRIPFTTGVLLGIGENYAERVDSILALRDAHARHGRDEAPTLSSFPDADCTGVPRLSTRR